MSPGTGRVRVGVVGVGYLGRYHAEKYARMDGVDLVAVVDTDRQRAAEVAARCGTEALYHHNDLLGRVDAASVAVPTFAHFQVSRDLLEGGVDVLIEKPMTTTVEEADDLIALSESRGRILQVGHLERFNPAVAALRDYVDGPLFIESHRLSTFKDRGTDVSVVLDLMIHDIDILNNLVHSKIRSIHAAGVKVISSHVDIANARLEFENGCVANVTASRISTKNRRKIRMFQKDAYISVDFAAREITVIRPGLEQPESVIPGMEIRNMCFVEGDALEAELTSFVHSVMGREPPQVSGKMGREALEAALTIMEQIRRHSDRMRTEQGIDTAGYV